MSIVVPGLAAMPNGGEGGRRRCSRIHARSHRGACGVPGLRPRRRARRRRPRRCRSRLVLFRLTTVAVADRRAPCFWSGSSGQITARGVGNGLALILLGFVLELPAALAATLELSRQGVLSSAVILGCSWLVRRLDGLDRIHGVGPAAASRCSIASRQVGMRMIEGRSVTCRSSSTPAGLDPGDRRVPGVVAHGSRQSDRRWPAPDWWARHRQSARPGRPSVPDRLRARIVLCALFYTRVRARSRTRPPRSRSAGGVIPGVRAGGADGRAHRYGDLAHHHARRRLSGAGVPSSRKS